MSNIFERLALYLRSELPFAKGPSKKSMSSEEWEAYQELEQELKRDRQSRSQQEQQHSNPSPKLTPEVLKAYKELDLPPGSSYEVVQKSYRYLILQHHPDRFFSDPQKYRQATLKTQKINEAFQILKKYFTAKDST